MTKTQNEKLQRIVELKKLMDQDEENFGLAYSDELIALQQSLVAELMPFMEKLLHAGLLGTYNPDTEQGHEVQAIRENGGFCFITGKLVFEPSDLPELEKAEAFVDAMKSR